MPDDLRIPGSTEGRRSFRFQFDGGPVLAYEGDTVAAALLAAGIRVTGHAPGRDGPQGLFCAMGICQECVVLVDGGVTEACRLLASEGLSVSSLR